MSTVITPEARLQAMKKVYIELRQLAHDNPENYYTQELFKSITRQLNQIKAEIKGAN